MNEDDINQASLLPDGLLSAQANPPHRILVVDDDSDIRRFCAEALAGSGYRVETAEDGAVAWETLQTGVFHLLITDYSMPKVTGVELLRKLHDARRALPVIMATGKLPKEEFTRCPWLQPAVALVKPYTLDELLASVKAVLHITEAAPRQLELLADPPGPASEGGLKLS